MEATIHTYGYIDAMFNALNGIAMIMNSTFGSLLIHTAVLVTIFYYVCCIVYSGNRSHQYLGKCCGIMVGIMFLLEQTSSVYILDHVSKKKEKVDNLPLAFVIPVGLLENFGNMLTIGFEQAFTPISSNDNTSYHDYGMLFGARLVQDSRNWKINNPEFLDNMSRFIDRCVVVDALIGYRYTTNDLFTSNDIWELVGKDAGTFRRVDVRVGQNTELMTCKDAADKVLSPAFQNEFTRLKDKYWFSEFGLAGSIASVNRSFQSSSYTNLNKNIELAFRSQMGSNLSAEQLIKQQLMINAINGRLKSYGESYGTARAEMDSGN